MTGLRERIEAERAALLDERAIAEAATPGPWSATTTFAGSSEINSDNPFGPIGDFYDTADAAHIARQDPATTLARIDRELARIDADLVLLTSAEGFSALGGSLFQAFSESANRNLNARYPEF